MADREIFANLDSLNSLLDQAEVWLLSISVLLIVSSKLRLSGTGLGTRPKEVRPRGRQAQGWPGPRDQAERDQVQGDQAQGCQGQEDQTQGDKAQGAKTGGHTQVAKPKRANLRRDSALGRNLGGQDAQTQGTNPGGQTPGRWGAYPARGQV